jgi:alpha-1,3-rhamnosyl/mannosyltransferase
LKVILSTDSIRFPLTGIGRYTYELGKHLGLQAEVDDLLFLHGTRLRRQLPEASQSPGSLSALRPRLQKNRLAVALFRTFEPRLKRRALRGLEDHVYHGTGFYLPPFDGTRVVTIHDLAVFRQPDTLPPERARHLRTEIEYSLRHADLLIAVSEFTRHELADYFGWPVERVHVTPLASAEAFRPREAAELTPVLTPHGLSPGGYVLFVGTIEPRKNIAALLDAYALLPDAFRRRWPLVLAGYQGWNSAAIHERIAQCQHAGWLHYLGFTAAQDLPPLMAGARLFAFPSLYEGFGLPVLEALASGVPVVCSNASSLPEVAGDAAAMCDPGDTEQLAALIAMGVEDESWRESARRKGLARAACFSWERCARETVEAYRSAQQSRPSPRVFRTNG